MGDRAAAGDMDAGERMSAESSNARIGGLRVLLYHAVAASLPLKLGWRERKFWMAAEEFRSHMALISSLANPVLDLDRAWGAKSNARSPASILWPAAQPAPVVLTFDDGRASDHSVVWPLVRDAGWSATFFVNTATLGKPGYLRWRDVREMSAGGALLASHGHRHVDFTALAPGALAIELRMSKDLIEGWTGRPVRFLAAPYGRVNQRVMDAALEAGYRAVCTSVPWPARAGAPSVSRVAIHATTGREELRRLIEGRPIPYWARQVRAACLSLPKRMVFRPAVERQILPDGAR